MPRTGSVRRPVLRLTTTTLLALLLLSPGSRLLSQAQTDVVSNVAEAAEPTELGPQTGTDEDFIDFAAATGAGDAKSTSSIGGADVAPSFNFTKAKLLRKMAPPAKPKAAAARPKKGAGDAEEEEMSMEELADAEEEDLLGGAAQQGSSAAAPAAAAPPGAFLTAKRNKDKPAAATHDDSIGAQPLVHDMGQAQPLSTKDSLEKAKAKEAAAERATGITGLKAAAAAVHEKAALSAGDAPPVEPPPVAAAVQPAVPVKPPKKKKAKAAAAAEALPVAAAALSAPAGSGGYEAPAKVEKAEPAAAAVAQLTSKQAAAKADEPKLAPQEVEIDGIEPTPAAEAPDIAAGEGKAGDYHIDLAALEEVLQAEEQLSEMPQQPLPAEGAAVEAEVAAEVAALASVPTQAAGNATSAAAQLPQQPLAPPAATVARSAEAAAEEEDFVGFGVGAEAPKPAAAAAGAATPVVGLQSSRRAAAAQGAGAAMQLRGQEHLGKLPGTMSEECAARLTAIVGKGKGAAVGSRSLEELLAEVAELKRAEAQQRTDEVLAALMAGDPPHRYTLFHLEHMTADYAQCQQSASVAAMRACLLKHRKGLANEQMRWFDEHFVTALLGLLPDVRSMFGFGSGRGDFERFFFQSGVNYTYGLEPSYLGDLGFYAKGWDYREGPVQLTALLPNATGVEELRDFRCFMLGDADARADLVQSFEVLEEIPREEHCEIINALAMMAGRWVAVTMGQLGQGGGHHIANRHREDLLTEWTRRGLKHRADLQAALDRDCYMCTLHYLRHNLLIFEVDASRVVPVDCATEDPAEWAPWENFVEGQLHMPNGSSVPAEPHRKHLKDWQYVLRLKAGR